MLLLLPMATQLLAMVVLATMARGLLMLSQRLMLMLVFSMEPMAMVPVLDMLDLDMDILVLDMLDMVVMDLDTVLDMDVPFMVKQLIYASKSSKVLFNYSVPSLGIGFSLSYSDLINKTEEMFIESLRGHY